MDGGERALAICMAVALAAAAVMYGGAAHAAQEGGAIPEWIKTVFGYYAAGQITDGEIIGALQYLIDLGVITLPATAGGEPAAPAAMSAEAKTAMAQADLLSQDVDDAGYWLADMRIELALGGHPQDGRAEFKTALAATERTMEAADAWAGMLRTAAGDGVITAAEQAAITAAEGAAIDAGRAERAVYDQEFAPWVEQLIDPYGDLRDAMNELGNALAADGDGDGDGDD